MLAGKRVLFVHHLRLDAISGVNVVLRDLLRSLPRIDRSIMPEHLSLASYPERETLLAAVDRHYPSISAVIGVNLHIEQGWDLALALAAHLQRREVPVYNYTHDYWPHHYAAVRQLMADHQVRLLASSRYIQILLADDGFAAELVPVGIALDNLALAASPAPAGRPLIGAVGRLVPRKRFRDIVAAFVDAGLDDVAGLYLRLLPSHVFSTGDDQRELQQLQQAVAAGPCAAAITLDHQTEPQHNYGRYTIYVCASDYEGFSITPIEAAYAGCPPIMSDIPAHRQLAGIIFGDQQGAFLYPLGDYRALGRMLRDEISSGRRRAYLAADQRRIRTLIERELSTALTARAIARLV